MPPAPAYRSTDGMAPPPYIPARRPKPHELKNIDDIREVFGDGYATRAQIIQHGHPFNHDEASDASHRHHHHLKQHDKKKHS
eukprot:9254528-Pyramimonas_sp.AAC.1